MSPEFFGKEISGNFTIPSGIVATSVPVLERLANDIPELGILTTKSISKSPRDGNREPILAQVSPGNWINAVGLTNPGAEKFSEQLSTIKVPKNRFLLASIVGSNENEFYEVAEKLINHVDGIELNVSCPHAEGHGLVIGQDSELVTKIIKRVKELNKPVVVKLSPKLSPEESIKAILKGGADGVAAINTWGPEDFMIDGNPVLSNKKGGFSGKQVLEKGVEIITELRKRTSLPIIGCGGISTSQDILKYKDAGANFFGIGSALAGMNTSELKTYFRIINEDLKNGTNHAESLLKTELNMGYEKIIVAAKEQVVDDLFNLKFENSFKAEAGQFVMLWSPEKGEKPFSVFNNKPFEVLFQKRGCFTEYLSGLRPGDELYVRGPYGNTPDVNGKLLLIGGGTGLASLKLFTERYDDTVVIVGTKDKDHLPNDVYNWKTSETTIYSNDGSIGKKGNATDDIEKIITDYQPNYILACGPKGMLNEVIRRGSLLMPDENILVSEELITMCGVGICGRCATKNGRRNCVDGTFI